MHEVVAQAGAAVRDAAICEGEVEFAERGWDVDEEEAVKEAYGCVPNHVRAAGVAWRIPVNT